MTESSERDSLALTLERLEKIVHELEGDDLDLDRALALFEDGVRHLRAARERLAEADGRVQRVLEDARGTLSITDLDV
ncbi:MAG: exodeoxyribonuclease VII small subunit [Gemmatimonadales bacterium]